MENTNTPLESKANAFRKRSIYHQRNFCNFLKEMWVIRIGSAQFWLGYFLSFSLFFLKADDSALKKKLESSRACLQVETSRSFNTYRALLSSVTASLFCSLNNFALTEKVSIVLSFFWIKTFKEILTGIILRKIR